MKTVAILEGWAGGPYLSRLFAKEAKGSGFQLTKTAKQADVIVAHSTACYLLPKKQHAKLVVLIDPPYWPDEPIVKRWINMNKNEIKMLIKLFGYRRFAIDKLWEAYYVFAKPRYTYSVLRNQSHLEFIKALSSQKVLLIRNTEDEFCSPVIKDEIKKHKNLKYFELPGYHGDYYHHPKPYIDLILKELQ
ncbi:MAG TPA: hypothetical protein VFP32_00155 [Candidatus Saccharimonadales bacterium]|nr:hypothetical protein [Candidatus Saccharimonadales bacterium]